MKRQQYQTAGRIALTEFLKGHPDRQFSAEELFLAVKERADVGKSSVYRHLGELCESETLRKFYDKERGVSVYQYVGRGCDCRDHFHQQCLHCGRISHLDCHATEEFARHLFLDHGFSVDCGQSILYGICAECQKKGESAHA